MNGYPYPSRPYPGNANASTMMGMAGDAIDTFDSQAGQSLDDIVCQNNKANRRPSMPIYPHAHQHMHVNSPEARRLSMLNFGDANAGDMDSFQFDMSTPTSIQGMMRTNTSYPRTATDMQAPRNPATDLAVNTRFAGDMSPYNTLAAPGSAYASPMHSDAPLNMDMTSYSDAMAMSLDMDDTLNMMPTDMAMYSNNQFNSPMMGSPLHPDAVRPIATPQQDNINNGNNNNSNKNNNKNNINKNKNNINNNNNNNNNNKSNSSNSNNSNSNNTMSIIPPPDHFKSKSLSNTPEARPSSGPPGLVSRTNSQDQSSMHSSSRPQSVHNSSSKGSNFPTQMSLNSLKNQQPIAQNPELDLSREKLDKLQNLVNNNLPWATPQGGFPSTMNSNPHMKTQFKNAYSSSGFDMLGVLMRVATRPDPQIDIGSVDLSCAFVVCDASMDDIPIVYCSDNFERLTGYTRHMILGRNCRFLQSPDGKVEAGIKRTYVDDDSVLYLKNTITARTEAQISLINYRRGGQPFMNLLTMIPIAWEPGGPIKFFVGFQVDLVEQPGAMTNKNPDGSFRVNYQRGMSMPSYVFNDVQKPLPEQGQTISKDEVSNVLAAYNGSGDSEITRRIWDKVLLENTDDVVHVLSLKGLFMYLSPSSNRILEYEPSELIGTALSSVCHPSDIVPVTRELKETSNGGSVNVVFRIRRKKSGYMWFEGHGSLHTEQGKGRKCIILVGRERPVYTLSKTIVRESGGIGDNELWTKMSTSGMFLFVSSNVRQLLDKQPEDLIGTSIQSLMRQESKVNFGRILELARGGRKGEVKHEMINKRGQVLQAFTTIYPGDATEGQKPTFVVGQTRLLKYSRNSTNSRPSMYTTKERNTGGSQNPSPTIYSGTSPMPGSASGQGTPITGSKEARFVTTEESPATFAGHNGLQLGRQDHTLASDDNVFDELKTTRSTSWQYELRQMEKRNRYLAEEVQTLLAAKKKRKRRKGTGQMQKDCANCHTRTTPEWRRGPSGNRDLCNSCGLRWAKQQGRVSPRTSSAASDKSRKSISPRHHQSHQTMLPNLISETGQMSSIPSTLAPPSKRPTEEGGDIDDMHAAKAARLEAAASQGFIPPPKINEDIEPPE